MKTRNLLFQTLIFGGALGFGSSNSMGQTFGMEYTTEWQTDFDGAYDWLNLLNITAEYPISDNLTIEASTISTAKSGECPFVDDLLTYSNIEAGNIPLTLARLGLAVKVRNADIFLGINNVNEDYFTSELTSFFTNSSCGISPTLSCNYDIANYPLASWCIHYRQQLGNFAAQTSLYPGKGYSRLLGHENIFSFDTKRDGIFSISSIDYKRNDLYCILGIALYHGVCMGDEEATQPWTATSEAKKRFSASPWALSEITLPSGLGILVHGSISTVKNGCKSYGSVGLVYNGKAVQPGMSLNYASFSETDEYALELTSRIPLMEDKAYIQPTIHLIRTDSQPIQCVGLLRLQVSL